MRKTFMEKKVILREREEYRVGDYKSHFHIFLPETPLGEKPKMYEAAILVPKRDYSEILVGWDVPEGFGLKIIPGYFTGLDDPELKKAVENIVL